MKLKPFQVELKKGHEARAVAATCASQATKGGKALGDAAAQKDRDRDVLPAKPSRKGTSQSFDAGACGMAARWQC